MTKAGAKGVINARAETAAIKPYFHDAFQRHRCVIPADGFYEWIRTDTGRVPHFFHRKDDRPFTFAGLYTELPGRIRALGFAILTTVPNPLVAKVHDRMPVMLEDGEEEIWLNSQADTLALQGLLDPFPAELMASYAVSRRVNHAGQKGPEVLDRAA